MDFNSPVLKLQLVTLFDSICFGLIYPFFNPYLMVLGGDHITIGLFSILYLTCQLVSDDFTKIITYNTSKKRSLIHVLAIALVTHVLITLTSNYWFVIFARCIFGLTNQATNLTKQLLIGEIPTDKTEHFIFVHNILSSVGYIVGPIISGCLFSVSFCFTCLLTAIFTILNIFLIVYMPDETPEEREVTESSFNPAEKVQKAFEDFGRSDYPKNWDLIALKYLFTTSISVFFTKFTQILKYNLNSDDVVIGYTTSYMNALAFAATYIVALIREKFSKATVLLTQISLLTLLISLIIACYAPIYFIYALACIPMIISRSYLNMVWKELYALRKNVALSEINEAVSIGAGLTVPLIFGVTCNVIGHHAVIFYSLVPIACSLFIYNKYTSCYEQIEDGKDKNKAD